MLSGNGNGAASPEELVARVQELTVELDSVGDPAVRARAEELIGAIIELYGSGLERVFGDPGRGRRAG